MSVDINLWGVLLAAVSSMIVGSIWYAQGVFGKTWGALAKVKMTGKPTFANMAPLLGTTFVASLITAYILAHFTFLAHHFFGGNWVWVGATTAFWGWLGFTACRILTHDLFENRPMKLTLLNWGNELVTLVVMGLVIGWLHP